MISVEEALGRLLAPLAPVPPEQLAIADCVGRVLAEDVVARRTQPPFAVSAMDGYAVRAADVERVPATLRIIAEIPAGAGFGGQLGQGEAARIFTGAPLPQGADTIVIQEDTERRGDRVEVREGAKQGTYVRRAGLDFSEGDELLTAHLNPRQRKLENVRRDPRVALSFEGTTIQPPGLRQYLVVYGRATIEKGGAPELLQELARVYLGPDVRFPPMDDPPPGARMRIAVERVSGIGPWAE